MKKSAKYWKRILTAALLAGTAAASLVSRPAGAYEDNTNAYRQNLEKTANEDTRWRLSEFRAKSNQRTKEWREINRAEKKALEADLAAAQQNWRNRQARLNEEMKTATPERKKELREQAKQEKEKGQTAAQEKRLAFEEKSRKQREGLRAEIQKKDEALRKTLD